jgi:hypothetical protein
MDSYYRAILVGTSRLRAFIKLGFNTDNFLLFFFFRELAFSLSVLNLYLGVLTISLEVLAFNYLFSAQSSLIILLALVSFL